jgi:Glycosyltransferase
MRILLVVPSIHRETGGPAKASLTLAKELSSFGQQVQVFSTLWPAPLEEFDREIECETVPIRLFRTSPIPGLGHLPYSRELVNAVRNEAKEFDAVLLGSLWNPLISQTISVVRRLGIPYAVMPHGMLDPVVVKRHGALKSLWSALWERRNVECASLMVFNSKREEAKAKMCGWSFRRTLVLPHTIQTTAIKNVPRRDQLEQTYPSLIGKRVIAFVGRINWVKNLDLLINAFCLLRQSEPNVILVCAGPDNDNHQRKLQKLTAGLGIDRDVLFTGMLAENDVQTVYARADVVVLVSKKENFGLSAAEALASGVPVVLSDGVDLGEDLPTPPVWRVTQNPRAIAEGISAALKYSQTMGLPVAAACTLAAREWGASKCGTLISALESIRTHGISAAENKGKLRGPETATLERK